MRIAGSPTEVPVLIVGAGIAGLAAARILHEAGVECRILEKSRGLGGRCATRRFDGRSFDHGAQFFTIRNPHLAVLATEWLEREDVREWCCGFPDGGAESEVDGYSRYCSRPGMNQVPKLLASALTIEKQILVTGISRQATGWLVSSECGRQWRSQVLVMTAPLPQALVLLGNDLGVEVLTRFTGLKAIDYDPCFTVMLSLADRSKIPAPGAIRAPNSVIDWIADNSLKHQTGQPGAVTVHTSADFTRDHFEMSHDQVAATVIEAARPWLGSKVGAWQVHRWRYARPRCPLSVGMLALAGKHPLVLSGDYLNAPARIEGAFDSGVAAATYILERV
jgi:hypothetical protein